MYAERRTEFAKRMNPGIAIFSAPPEAVRNYDVLHDFRQDSDLYYLLGFEEPDCILIISTKTDDVEVSLFLRSRDPDREIWDGPRLGLEAALETLGVDQTFDIQEFAERLPELMLGAKTIYYGLGRNGYQQMDRTVLDALAIARSRRRRTVIAPDVISEPNDLLHPMRTIKSGTEIELMRQAARLTDLGHRRAMAVTVPGVREYQVEAAMEYEWSVRGAMRNAYPSIVGSGPNACILHYRAGDRVMQDGELVLVDAGCEYGYYSSDVTRTWPVSGRFTEAQAAVYQIVLNAEIRGIDAARVGNTINDVHHASTKVLIEGLLELGLLEGTVDSCLADESYRRFYMHNTSHWIGLDVHDVGTYTEGDGFRRLEPGMVLTVEPGIYIQPHDETVPAEYRGIGIRIEDDVLVTAGEPDVLTASVPKEIEDIEAIVGTQRLSL